jgi:hypothetical protein
MNKDFIKDPNEIINELMELIKEKDKTINSYKTITDNNEIIIKGYKDTVKSLMAAIRTKDKLIDSLLQNSNSQGETSHVLLKRIEQLTEQLDNIKKIRPN